MNEALLERLQRLVKLHEAGKLSDDEFRQSKAALIAGGDDSAVDRLERLAGLAGSGGLSEDEFKQLKSSILGSVKRTRQEADALESTSTVNSPAARSAKRSGSRGWTSLVGIVAAVAVFGVIYYSVTGSSEPDCASAETKKLVTEIAKDNQVLFDFVVLRKVPFGFGATITEANEARSALREKLKKETSAKDYSLDVIRLQSKNTGTKAVKCKAVLRLNTAAGNAENEFSYSAEKTSGGGLYVELDTSPGINPLLDGYR